MHTGFSLATIKKKDDQFLSISRIAHALFALALLARKGGGGMVFAFLGGFAAQKCKNHLFRGFFTV